MSDRIAEEAAAGRWRSYYAELEAAASAWRSARSDLMRASADGAKWDPAVVARLTAAEDRLMKITRPVFP